MFCPRNEIPSCVDFIIDANTPPNQGGVSGVVETEIGMWLHLIGQITGGLRKAA